MMNLDQGGRRREVTRDFFPAPSIANVVERLWVDEWPQPSTNGGWRVVADDAPHIIWHLPASPGRHASPCIAVVGARTTYHDVDISGRLATIGVRLRPGALRALFERPAHVFTDRSTPLASLLNASMRRSLHGPMRCGPEHSVERLTTVIASLAEKGSGIDSRARWIAGHDPLLPARIETIASELGIPDRSLRAWSAAHLGMPIKSFFKIRRLHGALSMRIGSDAATWSQIAATAGYSDQSHLIRDCRTLLGESPGSFMARAS